MDEKMIQKIIIVVTLGTIPTVILTFKYGLQGFVVGMGIAIFVALMFRFKKKTM